jgi:16S rRNA (guanine527-N7)-methyltransferase
MPSAAGRRPGRGSRLAPKGSGPRDPAQAPSRHTEGPDDSVHHPAPRPRAAAVAATGSPVVARLGDAASRLGVSLDPEVCGRLAHFLELLRRWGAVHNLSAVDRPDDALVLHLFDSLAIVPLVTRALGAGGVVLDVGSGGGLPGVVLAAALPGVRVVCVDSVAKKMAFVRQVAIECGLPNLDALHARVETLGDAQAAGTPDLRRWARLAPRGADLIVSRAFAAVPDFVRWSERALAPEGRWLAMKGRRPDDELATLASLPRFEAFHVEPLQVPDLDAQRCAVWIRRVADHPQPASLAAAPAPPAPLAAAPAPPAPLAAAPSPSAPLAAPTAPQPASP